MSQAALQSTSATRRVRHGTATGGEEGKAWQRSRCAADATYTAQPTKRLRHATPCNSLLHQQGLLAAAWAPHRGALPRRAAAAAAGAGADAAATLVAPAYATVGTPGSPRLLGRRLRLNPLSTALDELASKMGTLDLWFAAAIDRHARSAVAAAVAAGLALGLVSGRPRGSWTCMRLHVRGGCMRMQWPWQLQAPASDSLPPCMN
jgi:hypothetical protein